MRSTVLTSLIAIFIVFGSATSQGAEFTMKQCEGSGYQGMSGRYLTLSYDFVDVVTGCNGLGSTKLGVYQDRSNRRIPFGNGGQFLWYTTGGLEIIETAISGKLNSRNGVAARLIGANESNANVALDGGVEHSGADSVSHWRDTSNPITVVVGRLACQLDAGCENNTSSGKAFLELTDMEFSVRDTRSPSVSASGQLMTWGEDGKWHRGVAAYSVTSSDQGSGISRSFLKVNESIHDTTYANCPAAKSNYATSFNPCPATQTYQDSVDTTVSPFQEGLNRLQFCTEDYSISASSGSPICTNERWVFVDNLPPDAPAVVQLEGAGGWRSVNSFDLDWSNPPAQYSRISGAEYSIYDDQDVLVQGPTRVEGLGINSLRSIQVPSPGSFRIAVRLLDEAGNLGQSASTVLKFDDGRPGNVAPENAPGWISSDEFPLRQTIERAATGGPSGVEGYAMEISRTGSEHPCPSGTCAPDQLDVAGGQDQRSVVVPDLSEGTHWISTVAASGARLASEEPQTVEVHVDKTDPVTTLEGAPTGWVNHPVTLTAKASDDASGMTPLPGGDPVTVIEPAEQSPYMSPGPSAKFTVANEGATVVKYWARDFAGNANDGGIAPDGDRHRPPGSVTIRIDSVAPEAHFVKTIDRSDPEMVKAEVRDRDSGVKEARIAYRRAGVAGEFTPLSSQLRDGQVLARLPSDDLGEGAYELKIDSTDWAGNSATSTVDGSGETMVLNVPLKEEVSLSAGLLTKKGVRREVRIRPKKRATVLGSLMTRLGDPVPRATIEVTEAFAPGSSRPARVTTTQTGDSGGYQLGLGKGPTRKVTLVFVGNATLGRTTSRTLTIRAYDRTVLKIRPNVIRNGGSVKMTGSVRGPGGLARASGKLVAIQYYDPSRAKWRPAEVIRTNRRGRFSYRYRFRTITVAQRIIFRATSLPEAGWPFLPSTSRPKSVIVYPRTGS